MIGLSLLARFGKSFSFIGLVSATLFFAASLTPSLLPRPYLVQGILSGFALAVGYAVGVLGLWTWLYLELPKPSAKLDLFAKIATTFGTAGVSLAFLRCTKLWQNSIRDRMGMPEVETAYPLRVALIALFTAVGLVLLTRGIVVAWKLTNRQVNRLLPRRVSYVMSTIFVATLAILIANKVLVRLTLDAADEFFLQLDQLVDEGIEQPKEPLATGSNVSLIEWDSIGRRGKDFLVRGPSRASIAAWLGREAEQPIRVYAGLGNEDTMEERAKSALEELKRVGGFDRKLLVVATPTGTGWLDESAVDTIEYMHGGDTAIVSMQYSYLPSWVTIVVDPQRSINSARALFDEVYGYWRTLPKDRRPKLYLYGLSLGALGGETCADLFTLFADPIHGGVFSGPPFPSRVWNDITKKRTPDSPMWLPKFRDGSMVRFTAQKNHLDQAQADWGPMRFVYIQYASDPMVFFSTDLAYRKPAWINEPRGPDVSNDIRWYPLVTFLQVGFDLPLATSVPIGHGHNYAPSHYIDAWSAVTAPSDWNEDRAESLKKVFKPTALEEIAE